jgi:flavin reductase (DIM6/NTAB) family NADH-FMN oxidoreductase RutF
MAVDPQAFKQAMSQFASGVTVVTTVHEGQRYGLTASSFTSVSVDPPLVLVCLGKQLRTHDLIADTGVFAVNVLGAHQLELGMRFAGLTAAKDRFAGLATATAETGSPILPEVLAWVDCRLRHLYEGGDHSIFVGEVVALSAAVASAPLLYHNRLWHRTEPL